MGIINFSKSNNYLIWAVLLFIAFGFGKCENIFDFKSINICDDSGKRDGHNHKKNSCYSMKNVCKSKDDDDLISKLTGSNALFIVFIIVLLILCKDSKEQCKE